MEHKYIWVTYKLYTIDNGASSLVEEATQLEPFQFISGIGAALDKFEQNLCALGAGEKFDFTLTPDEAYGTYYPEGVRKAEKSMFEIDGHFDAARIFEGNVVPLQDTEGTQFLATVVEVTDDSVTFDLNHPLAGKNLRFKGEILESHLATDKEVEDAINMMAGEGCHCDCCEGHCDGGCNEHDHHGHGGHHHCGHCH